MFNPEVQETITEGANVMLAIAHRLPAQQKERVVVRAPPAPQGVHLKNKIKLEEPVIRKEQLTSRSVGSDGVHLSSGAVFCV